MKYYQKSISGSTFILNKKEKNILKRILGGSWLLSKWIQMYIVQEEYICIELVSFQKEHKWKLPVSDAYGS